VLDIYGSKRAELNRAVFEHVKGNFEEYGIVIDSVNFSRIGLDEQTSQAIQQIVNAQQELKKVEIEKQKAQLEAERSVIEAEGKSKVTAINAQATADANAKIQASLTPELVQKLWIEKWDGVVSKISGGSGTIINADSIMGEAVKK
jgi:regulator of protease activity HflC (stomatin/prohibitin superfamily)